MKKYLFAGLVLLLAALMSGCMDYETEYKMKNSKIYIYADDDVVILPATTTDTLLLIRSNVAWKVEDNDSGNWLELTPAEDCSSDSYATLRIRPNTTERDRRAQVTVQAGDDARYSNTIVLLQKRSETPFVVVEGLRGLVEEDGMVHTTKRERVFPLTIASNTNWQIRSEAEWCTFRTAEGGSGEESVSDGPGQTFDVDLVVEENATGEIREALLVAGLNEGGEAERYVIFQVHTDDPGVPILTVVDTEEKLEACWSEAEGAVGEYVLEIADDAGHVITTRSCGDAHSFDLTDFEAESGDGEYVGPLRLRVRMGGRESNAITAHSHFASGKGTAEDPFVIRKIRQIHNVDKVLAKNGGYLYYALGCDIAYEESAFIPIGTAGQPFVGTFDGRGYAILGADKNLKNTEEAYALFGYVGNLPEKVSLITGIVFSDCHFAPAAANKTPDVAAFAHCVAFNRGAEVSDIRIRNCVAELVSGNTNNNQLAVGGVVGQNGADATGNLGRVVNCYTDGGRVGRDEIAPQSGNNNNNTWYAGGIVGMNDPYCTVESCGNDGTVVNGRYAAGGIVGYNEGDVRYCYNKGPVSGSVGLGGVVGGKADHPDLNYRATIESCFNSGDVVFSPGNVAAYIGGVTGGELLYNANRKTPVFLAESGPDPRGKGLDVRSCFNRGLVYMDTSTETGTAGADRSSATGGLVGHIYRGTIADCYNRGEVRVNIKLPNNNQSIGRIGGLVGWFRGSADADVVGLEHCYNAGTLTVLAAPQSRIGGVAGDRNAPLNVNITGVVCIDSFDAQDGLLAGNPGGNIDAVSFDAASMGLLSSYPGWDFGGVWKMEPGTYPYPRLTGTLVGGNY